MRQLKQDLTPPKKSDKVADLLRRIEESEQELDRESNAALKKFVESLEGVDVSINANHTSIHSIKTDMDELDSETAPEG